MVDTVVIQKEEPGAPEGHDKAMIDKVDAASKAAEDAATPAPVAEPKVKPEGIPDKFWDAEKGEVRVAELAKSYTELESQKGKPAEEPKVDETDPAKAAADAEDAAKAVVEGAGLDFAGFSQEFAETGDLSPESRAKLNKAGIPDELIDQHMAGARAIGSKMEAEIKEVAGGEEGFAKVAEWATENLSDEEKVAYNKAIDSKDVAQAKLAVAGITAKYKAANPDEPSLLSGKTKVSDSSDVYESIAQLTADQKKPEYKKDPAFRAKVEAKLARSKIL